jgi:Uma2 family endonuclease
MATATIKRVREFDPYSAGMKMSPREFDRAKFVEGSRYELINGILVVTPVPVQVGRDLNEELGFLLRTYQRQHVNGAGLNGTLPEQTVKTGRNRRCVDRVIWAGLGRKPRRGEKPTVAIDIVSEGKRYLLRDYEIKRLEYEEIGVVDYWIIDRFQRTMTVYRFQGGKSQKRAIREKQTYTTDLLPGFELPLARLLALADNWAEREAGKD